jgi:competence protein ComEA
MRFVRFFISLAVVSLALSADDKPKLPDAPGKDTLLRVCGSCHGAEIVLGKRLSRDGWNQVVVTMVQRGAQGTDDELSQIVDYLSTNLSPDSKIKTAAAVKQPPAADLPDGPGKAATIRICGKCHAVEKAVSLHQDEDGWTDTISKMVKMGAQGSDDEFTEILAYLSKNFGEEAAPPIDINKADSVDLESSLVLTRTESAALIKYRTEKGPFKSVEDLRNIPGLDFKKIESQKSRITF